MANIKTTDEVFKHNWPKFIEREIRPGDFPKLKCLQSCNKPIEWYYEYDWDSAFVRCNEHRIKKDEKL